jgi:putative ABC transport system permease protein
MIKNLSKVAVRHLQKHWVNSGISLLGLSIGFLSVLLIGLYIDHETHYDRFHSAPQTIFRLTDSWGAQFSETRSAIIPNPWADALASEFPEVAAYTRIHKRLRFNPLISNGDVRFFESGFIGVDTSFFQVFNFKLKFGDTRTALREPNSILITASKAKAFFGDQNPIDKVLLLDNKRALRVTGVIEEPPSQSHIDFNFILPIDSLPRGTSVYSYFRIAEATDVPNFEQKITPFLKQRFLEKYPRQKYEPKFQQLTDIHLYSDLEYEFKANGSVSYLRLMSAIGILILLVAVFNCINLNVAMVSLRVKEFGVRKILGGMRQQVLVQIVIESIVLCMLSFCIALILGSLLNSTFSSMLSRQFDWNSFVIRYLPAGLIFSMLVAVLSALYPSLLLFRIKLPETLGGRALPLKGRGLFIQSLVGSQYVISMLLVSGTLVIYFQLEMLSTTNLGFDRSQVLVINGRVADGLDHHLKAIKDAFERLPEVENVAFSQTVPGDYSNMASISYEFEGVEEARSGTKTIFVSADFVETLGISMASGRDFSEDFKSDSAAYVINEACAKMVGWENPVGKKMRMTIIDKMEGPVIGVMKDFHFASLHSAIEPIALVILPESFQKILVRTKPGVEMKTVLAKLSDAWSGMMPDYPFDFQFLDQKFAGLYEADRQFAKVFQVFTAIGIFLTCIGLHGMISFNVSRRMKEIGIRKISGASSSNIFFELNLSPFKLMTFSLAVSIPLTWYVLSTWLANFAYAINIEWWIFALTIFALMVVTVLTTGHKIFKAAGQNPVEVLKEN